MQTEPAGDDWARHHERRTETRHDAKRLGEVTARLVGGAGVRLVNFSNRGILVESDSRLQIGARASVRITTKDASIIVTGIVVRSRVKGLVNGVLLYDAGLNLDSELSLVPAELESEPEAVRAEDADPEEAAETWADEPSASLELEGLDGSRAVEMRQPMNDEAMLQLFTTVPQDLAELRRLAASNQW
jgi:hypothetical protein